jgi:hypothetical protein
MHSSTSNSKPVRYSGLVRGNGNKPIRIATVTLIASILAVTGFAEIASRYAFPGISRIESRIRSDEAQVAAIRSSGPGSPPVVLLVGNSLLLQALDYPRIQSEMASEGKVVRFVIENTEYLDWYYGLRHLFDSGVRPSTVVVCLSIGQAVSSKTLGDYSAYHLFGVSQLLPVAHDAGMDATRTTSLVLAHWSSFYANRATIRNFILNRSAPGYAAAMHYIADNTKETLPPDEEIVEKARKRIRAMQQLCHQYGVQLVILVPPSLGPHNSLLASAAELEQTNADDPLPFGTVGPEFFQADRFHMNEKGAAVFTQALARSLHQRLASSGQMEVLPAEVRKRLPKQSEP